MATLNYLQASNNITNTATYSFTSRNIGPEASDRFVIVTVSSRSATLGNTLVSATIGGIAATLVGESTNSASNTSSTTNIIMAAVPTGTSATVALTYSASIARVSIAMFAAFGINPTAIDVKTSTNAAPSATLTTQTGGFVIATAMSNGNTSTTWSGANKIFDVPYGNSGATHSGATAVDTPNGTMTVGATFAAPQITSGVFASWANTSTTAPSAGSGSIKVWNGSAWVTKPIKVWNGSAWVTKPIKVWNGSNYI